MLRHNKGLTLIELVITLFVASVMLGAVFVLTKSYNMMSGKIKATVDLVNYSNQFIDVFTDEVSSAYQASDVDAISLSSGTIRIANETLSLGPYPSFVQQVTYTVKALAPSRTGYPSELGIYKTKSVNGINVYSDQLVLAGVNSFSCTPTVNNLSYVGALYCNLQVYADRSDPTKLSTYGFYTNAENQP